MLLETLKMVSYIPHSFEETEKLKQGCIMGHCQSNFFRLRTHHAETQFTITNLSNVANLSNIEPDQFLDG